MMATRLLILTCFCLVTNSLIAEVFNVKDYGAVGDGLTNDSDAFNTAMTLASVGGNTVYVPCGIYLLGKDMGNGAGFYSGLQIKTSNISVVGEGRCSELQPVNSAGNAIISLCSTAKNSSCKSPLPISNIRIANLAFNDPAPFEHVGSEESHGIVAKNVRNLVIENNFFIGIGDESVDIVSSEDVTVRGNHFDWTPSIPDARAATISISGSKHVSVLANSITNARFSTRNRGIDISTSAGKPTSWVNISDNRFLNNNYAYDIHLSAAQADIEHIVISSNMIESRVSAIKYSGSSFMRNDIRIVDNDMSGNIDLRANNLLIADNAISGTNDYGLRVSGHDVKIVNNIIKDFPSSCMFVSSPALTGTFEFSGNSCIDTSSSGADVVYFFKPNEYDGKIVIRNNIISAADGANNGISRVGTKYGLSGGVDAAITGNMISNVRRGISGGGLIANNVLTDIENYGLNITQDAAQLTNNKITTVAGDCIYVSARDVVATGNLMAHCAGEAFRTVDLELGTICVGNNARNNNENSNIECSVMVGNIEPDTEFEDD